MVREIPQGRNAEPANIFQFNVDLQASFSVFGRVSGPGIAPPILQVQKWEEPTSGRSLATLSQLLMLDERTCILSQRNRQGIAYRSGVYLLAIIDFKLDRLACSASAKAFESATMRFIASLLNPIGKAIAEEAKRVHEA